MAPRHKRDTFNPECPRFTYSIGKRVYATLRRIQKLFRMRANRRVCHSHSQARPIDILTTTAPSVTVFDVVIVAVSLSPPAVEVCCGFVSLDRPRAHAPPALAHLIARAPPACH